MTSALKFGGVEKYPDFVDKYYINFADREGGGGKKNQVFVDVKYGSSLEGQKSEEEP